MRRSEISALDRIGPIGLADRSQATRKSLSATKYTSFSVEAPDDHY
jgi:hypothetical protein